MLCKIRIILFDTIRALAELEWELHSGQNDNPATASNR